MNDQPAAWVPGTTTGVVNRVSSAVHHPWSRAWDVPVSGKHYRSSASSPLSRDVASATICAA
jgi:hypothetical protein